MIPRHLLIALPLMLVACRSSSVSPPGSHQMEAAAAGGSSLTGRDAPAFKLLDQDGTTRTLADYRGGWLVLYFYPKDDTPGCTCQATEFTALLTEFNDLNARVVGVSPDAPVNHRFFSAKYDLRFTLLSDPDRVVMRRYGAWVETPALGEGTGRVIRSTVLIDPQGRIAHHWPEVIPQGHAQRVREKLAEVAAR